MDDNNDSDNGSDNMVQNVVRPRNHAFHLDLQLDASDNDEDEGDGDTSMADSASLRDEDEDDEAMIEANNGHNRWLLEPGIAPEGEAMDGDNDDDEDVILHQGISLEDMCRALQKNRLTRILGRGEMERMNSKAWYWAADDVTFAALGNAMSGNTTIRDMTVVGGNAPELTAQGAMALANGICHTKLRHLRLSNMRSDLQNIMFEYGIHKSATITALSICDVIHVPTAMHHLFRSPATSALSELSIVACPLTVADMTCLMQGLRGNTCLKTLRFLGCSLGDTQVAAFCQSWSDDSGITQLEFSSDDRCVRSKQQEEATNVFGPAGVRALMSAVTRHPSMRRLALNMNSNIGYEGITNIGEGLSQVKLQELEFRFAVAQTTDGKVTYTPEVQEARDKAGRALIEGVKFNVHLYHVDACYFGVEDHVREEIQFYLELNDWGRNLLPRNVSDALWCHVLALFRKFPSRMYYFLREQPSLMSATTRQQT